MLQKEPKKIYFSTRCVITYELGSFVQEASACLDEKKEKKPCPLFCAADIYEQPGDSETEAPPPKYQHVVIPGNRDRNESYLTLALEAALIGLFIILWRQESVPRSVLFS